MVYQCYNKQRENVLLHVKRPAQVYYLPKTNAAHQFHLIPANPDKLLPPDSVVAADHQRQEPPHVSL